MRWTDAEDDYLRERWMEFSHLEMAGHLGKSRPAVRNRCYRLGLVNKDREWSEEEISALVAAYSGVRSGDAIALDVLAARLGRLKSNVCRKARSMGLTDKSRNKKAIRKVRVPKFSSKEDRAAHMSAITKKRLADVGHPRGALGMKHTDQTKALISEKSKAMNAARTEEEKAGILMKAMRTRVKNGSYAPHRPHATWRAGWREIGSSRKYYRSRWEANYARYLEWLRERGEILGWEHEPETFWFDGVRRGTCSYLPDFRVSERDGNVSYHEVKGWMDARSKTKIARMAKYHPDVVLVVIREKQYMDIARKFGPLIRGWE